MSENYRYYEAKMAGTRARRIAARPLHGQLVELIAFVKACEERWESAPEPTQGSGDDKLKGG